MMNKTFCIDYLKEIELALASVSCVKRDSTTKKVEDLSILEALNYLCIFTHERSKEGGRVFILGNGASNALASAMTLEFVQNAEVDCTSFTSSAYLSAMYNDKGGASNFTMALKNTLKDIDLLVGISSSGKSQNIIKAFKLAEERGCATVSFSAMQKDNPTFTTGQLNFHVPIDTYSGAEITHYTLMQMWYEMYMLKYLPEKLPEKYELRNLGDKK